MKNRREARLVDLKTEQLCSVSISEMQWSFSGGHLVMERKRKDDAWFHNPEITVNPPRWKDQDIFFGIRNLMLCFYTFLHIYFFFVFLSVRMYSVKVSWYIFRIGMEYTWKTIWIHIPLGFLAIEKMFWKFPVLGGLPSIWITCTESAFLPEVPELALRIVSLHFTYKTWFL